MHAVPSLSGANGLRDLELTGVSADSRAVAPGELFVALPGTRNDGRAFIAQAVARGAAAVLSVPGTVWPEGVPQRPLVMDPEPRRALARLAAAFAGRQPATVVAVTGTNGKTSTGGIPAPDLGGRGPAARRVSARWA